MACPRGTPLRAPAGRAVSHRPRTAGSPHLDVRSPARPPGGEPHAPDTARPALAGAGGALRIGPELAARVARGQLPRRARAARGDRAAIGVPQLPLAARSGHAQPRGVLVRLRKQREFITRAKTLEHLERDSRPPVDALLTVMAACAGPCSIQLALTPAGVRFESLAKRIHSERETARLTQRPGAPAPRRTMLADAELKRRARALERAALLRRYQGPRPEPLGMQADRRRALLRARGEPPRRTRDEAAPRPARAIHPSDRSRRGQAHPFPRQGGVRPRRARRALAAALARLCRRAIGAQQRARRARATRRRTGSRRATGMLRDETGRSRSRSSCESRTRRCRERSSRARRASSSPRSPRTCVASAAR